MMCYVNIEPNKKSLIKHNPYYGYLEGKIE